MAEFEIVKAGRYKLIEDRLKNPRGMMERIGAMLTSRAQRAFDEQKRGSVKWPPRSVPNIAGIVDD
jgi:hypothetical protein